MNILEVKNLTKTFADFTAVDDISFSLKEGEILGMLGPNGAGKTTTLQMILGVLSPTCGEIKYFGKDFESNREEILEKVNFSSTYTNLPVDLTVAECMKYTAYLYKIDERKKRTEEIKKLFRLEELWKQPIKELSAGQLTRVNLAKAFINFPRVLLLDEPTASLDPDVSKYIRDFLYEEKKNFNVSIIITSHNMSEVQELCDRVIFINEGKIVADDTPKNLAKTMSIAHVELLIECGMEKLIVLLDERKIKYRVKEEHINIDMEEKEVADFLEELKKEGICYDEISIQKPTLEDYFLQMTLRNK
jgi:ABC-2 type transport system ATP-binding protein